MTGYQVDWVGAIDAGVVAAIVFSLSTIADGLRLTNHSTERTTRLRYRVVHNLGHVISDQYGT